MADNDKKPMSRLMKLANKFNCFYLSGKRARRVAAAPPRIIVGDASPGRVIDRNDAGSPFARTAENIDLAPCVYLPFAFRRKTTGWRWGKKRERTPDAYRGSRLSTGRARLRRVPVAFRIVNGGREPISREITGHPKSHFTFL